MSVVDIKYEEPVDRPIKSVSLKNNASGCDQALVLSPFGKSLTFEIRNTDTGRSLATHTVRRVELIEFLEAALKFAKQ